MHSVYQRNHASYVLIKVANRLGMQNLGWSEISKKEYLMAARFIRKEIFFQHASKCQSM